MKVKSFTFFEEYYELITLLDEKEQKELILAILKYMFEDIEPSLNTRETKVFNNLKRPLIISKNKSNSKQNKIKLKSNENQNKIKSKSNQDETTSVVTKSMSMSNNNINNIYFNNIELNNLFKEYLDLRIKLKCKNTDRAISLLLNELNKFDDETKKQMINNSIMNSWKSVYPIKESKKAIVPSWLNEEIKEEGMTDEEVERAIRELEKQNEL